MPNVYYFPTNFKMNKIKIKSKIRISLLKKKNKLARETLKKEKIKLDKAKPSKQHSR
jgi:hypothetical protein